MNHVTYLAGNAETHPDTAMWIGVAVVVLVILGIAALLNR